MLTDVLSTQIQHACAGAATLALVAGMDTACVMATVEALLILIVSQVFTFVSSPASSRFYNQTCPCVHLFIFLLQRVSEALTTLSIALHTYFGGHTLRSLVVSHQVQTKPSASGRAGRWLHSQPLRGQAHSSALSREGEIGQHLLFSCPLSRNIKVRMLLFWAMARKPSLMKGNANQLSLVAHIIHLCFQARMFDASHL